ncbi:hypothetical protein ACSBR1_027477 [Camellia fascicularis]
MYLQPTNVVIECKFVDPKKDQFSIRNVVPRLIFRSLSVVIATLLAAMLPFFGGIMALFGPFGCIPLDFILPMIFYNVTFKPSKKSIIFWGNTFIATISIVLSLVGAVASVRQIVLHAKTYHLFANIKTFLIWSDGEEKQSELGDPSEKPIEDPILEYGEDMDVVKDKIGDSQSMAAKFENDQKNDQEASNVGQFSGLTPMQMHDMLDQIRQVVEMRPRQSTEEVRATCKAIGGSRRGKLTRTEV